MPVNQAILKQYTAQRTRGWEGFGVFNGKYVVKAAMEERIDRWLNKDKNNSDLLLFHHRMPTSTINVRKAAHPFTTGKYFGDVQYTLVHNGWICNDNDLFVDHQELGIEYQSLLQDMTFNDSESLLWDFALTMEGKQDKLKAWGNIAFVCIKTVNGSLDKLYFGRNYSKPLNMKRDDEGLMLSSEGEGESIDANQLYTYNYAIKRLTKRHFYIPATDPTYRSEVRYSGFRQPDNACATSYVSPYEGSEAYLDQDGHLRYREIGYGADDFDEIEFYRRMDAKSAVTHQIDTILNDREDKIKIDRYRKVFYDNNIPVSKDAFDLLCRYMKEADGNYDDVEWALQSDYEDLEVCNRTLEVQSRMDLILDAFDLFYRDPGNSELAVFNRAWMPIIEVAS